MSSRIPLIAANLIPVLWAGEAEIQWESGEFFSILEKQISHGLKGKVNG